MQALLEPLKEYSEYRDILYNIEKDKFPLHVSGCMDSQFIHFINSLKKDSGFKNQIIVTYDEQRAKSMAEDYRMYDRNVMYYPAKDLMFFSADIHGNLILQERLHFIKRFLEGENITLITTIDGLSDRQLPLNEFKNNILEFSVGDVIDMEKIRKQLVKMGYQRTGQVDMTGQFAVRGSIIDIFPLTDEVPVRIDLWGDEVDSVKSFDVESQRSVENFESIKIYPASEYMIDEDDLERGIQKIKNECDTYEKKLRKQMKTEEAHRIRSIVDEFVEQLTEYGGQGAIDSFITYMSDKTVSVIEYFNKEDTMIILDEPARIDEKCKATWKEFSENIIHRLEKGYVLPGQTDILISYKDILATIWKNNTVVMTTLEQNIKEIGDEQNFHVDARNVSSYNNNFELLIKDLKDYKKKGYRVVILTASKTRAARLADDIRGYDIEAFSTDDESRVLKSGEILVTAGNVHKGFEYPFLKFAVITETDIFGKEKKRRKKKKTNYSGEKIQNFTDLNIGDYVVHENHGLGIYRGIEKIEVDKIAKDYIKIEYAAGGNLYILATQLDMIQKYSGADARKPKLNKLGTQEWNKTKTRVRGAVKDMAAELVKLYAARQEKEGYVYGPDTVWQSEFEEMFPYDETDDQLTAIEDTKKDMESPRIMDRLICGDVGYGKTEVAIRAAFKAVQDGKQVAFLVPTTILAQQHYNTFASRMKDFAVNVDMMSRFRTAAQQKKTIEQLKNGMVDIVIGTHRILSKDVQFKDLGLLIIDEEQRFGVAHKEKIKQLKNNIDVLTLSATPIPRTLHMSLVGIRDMSVLEEPPVDRLPIQTYIMEYDDEMIREAINRELARNGQVYYVYNRVNNIDEVAAHISKLVPDANVAFAHGQMSERTLEKIMLEFIEGEIDVLVSTTIIETGLDISNVNTMIIHDADNMGLSQLYQLRGRVGRSNRTSYAFLMYRRNKVLREVAEKRLKAIREFTELGSGIKIAMKDLEIRGAGNVLGAEQHGHMEAVGYDLYCKMLNEAVQMYKGIKKHEEFETTIDLNVDAFIPPAYIKNEFQKLNIYKRIAGIETEEECEDMQDELMDRYGDMPKAVLNLLAVALMKSEAHRAFITDVTANGKTLKLAMLKDAEVDVSRIGDLLETFKPRLKFIPGEIPVFEYKMDEEIRDVEKFRGIFAEVVGGIQGLIK